MAGHSDLAIGTRLHRSSRVVRGARRELISRCYHAGLTVALGAGFTDAQCGFKAIRADVARELLPLVEDDRWFFDTELLVLAERCGLRAGTLPVEDIRARMGRTMPGGGTGGQALRFGPVGAFTTVVHLGGFALLEAQRAIDPQPANVAALLVATILNTSLNRRWTFQIRTSRGAWAHQAQGLVLLLLTWLLTAGALAAVTHQWPTAPTVVQTVAVAAATVVATVTKFAVMRRRRQE